MQSSTHNNFGEDSAHFSCVNNFQLSTYQRGSFHRHEELKTHLATHPELLGIQKDDIISVETEFELHRRRRAVVAKPDLVISYKTDNGIKKTYVEIKSGSCRRAKANLYGQLRKISNYLRRHKLEGEVLGVYPFHNTLEFIVL